MIYDQAEDTLLNKKYKAMLCDYTLIIYCITHTIIVKQWECIIKINVGNLKNIRKTISPHSLPIHYWYNKICSNFFSQLKGLGYSSWMVYFATLIN